MRTIAFTYQPYLGRVMAALACLCAVFIFLYGALLLETVAHAAGRENAQSKIEALNAQLSALEGQYLSATQAITPQRAAELGFVPAKNVSTVMAQAPLEPLTLR